MAQPFAVPAPKPLPLPEGGGDRNAIPIYTFPNAHVVHHFIPDMPVRISAMRALGAYHNVFSIESFMDELADARGRRSRRVPAEASRRSARPRRDREGGARSSAGTRASRRRRTAATALPSRATRTSRPIAPSPARSRSNRETGRARLVRAVAAVDSGQVVNPDGLTNQIEGAIMQSTSWTLYEARHLRRHAGSPASTGRPIRSCASMRCPRQIEVHIINRPGTAVPRQRRDRAGPGGGLGRKCDCQRHRQTATKSAADAKAHQGCDRRVSAVARRSGQQGSI